MAGLEEKRKPPRRTAASTIVVTAPVERAVCCGVRKGGRGAGMGLVVGERTAAFGGVWAQRCRAWHLQLRVASATAPQARTEVSVEYSLLVLNATDVPPRPGV